MVLATALLLFTFFTPELLCADSPLQPIRLDHPRDTMTSYIKAMNDYQEGLTTGDKALVQRIDDAARCLDLSEFPVITRAKSGRKAAILLKEVLDRVIIVDFQKIPDHQQQKKWRLKDSEISIIQIDSGPNRNDYLFSSDTVLRAEQFYNKVKHLPYLKGTKGAGFKEPWYNRLQNLLQDLLPPRAQEEIGGMEGWKWLALFLGLLAGFFSKLLLEFSITVLKKLTSSQKNSIRHQLILALDKPIGLLGATLVWFFCIHFLQLKGLTESTLLITIQVIFYINLIWAFYRLTYVCENLLKNLFKQKESDLGFQLIPLLSQFMRLFVILIGGLMAMQNLGVNVFSLLAGLGIGGLAFALAARDMVANFFGFIMILIDRPFRQGDWIITNDTEGSIETIGFRSTKVRTFYDSVISLPNASLANANIDNMGQRHYRRIKTYLGLTYDTSPAQIQKFISGIKEIIQKHPHTRKDNYHVVLHEYGPFSLNVLLYFFIKVPNWSMELIERQNIFLEIMKLAQKIGVEFAFPTQTLHIDSHHQDKPNCSPSESPS